MKNLIKCHLNYLISKTTIIVSLIAGLIIVIISISSVLMLDKNVKYSENNYLYFYNGFLITKIIIVIFSVFIFGYSFSSKSDQYIIILVAAGITRTRIITTKILALSMVMFILCYFSYFQYLLIGLVFFKEFIFMMDYLIAYIALYMIAYFFGLVSMLLIQIFDNIYTIIIPFALMNLSEILNEYKGSIIKVINLIIPYYTKDFTFEFGWMHALIWIIIQVLMNAYYYDKKDIKC